MKTKLFLGGLLLATFMSLTGCHKGHDKSPEIVTDPLKDTKEYYIAGVVTANDAPLSGVTVASDKQTVTTDADGKYKLTVNKPATYNVAFTKEGYLKIDNATAVIANNATNRSSVTLSVKMSKESEKVEVKTSENVVVTDKGTGLQPQATTAVEIPAGALETTTEVSVTPYQEPAPVSTEVQTGTTAEPAAITNIVINTSEDVTLQKPVTLSVINKATENTYFDEVEVYSKNKTKAAGDWKKETNALFDAASNSYKFTLQAGKKLAGEYSVRVKNTKTTGNKATGENNIDPLKVSNAGNMDAILDYKINFDAWAGWSYTLSPEDALKNVVSNNTDVKGMAAMINAAIEAQEGTYGTYKVHYSLTTNISGNYIMYYTNKASYCEKTYTFKLNGGKTVTVKLKCYIGMIESYINIDSNQHSGGDFGGK